MNSNVKLSWAGFSAKSTQTLRDILQEKDFTDVTLAAEDGAQISAHQVILSSGSDFFKRILRMSKIDQQRPFLFLSGLKGSLVAALVDFIYLGECSVNEEDLDQFVKTGKEFGLQGIEEVALEGGYDEEDEETIEKENNVEKTLSPSLLEIDDEMLPEEHPFKLDLETLSDDGTFPVDVIDMLEDHLGDVHENNQSSEIQANEKLPTENPTATVENQEESTYGDILEANPQDEVMAPCDLLDAVSDEDSDDDGAVINPSWNLDTMTGILPSEIVSDDLPENLDELTTQTKAVESYHVQRNSESDELLDLKIDDLLKDVEENIDVANTGQRIGKALNTDLVHATNTPSQGLVSIRSLKVDVKNMHLVDHKEEFLYRVKVGKSGRELNAKEIEFVSLQHERNNILHADERGEAGEKRLVAIRKRLYRLYPMDIFFEVPFLKSVPKSPSERKRDSRNAMSVEARNIEKERNRIYKATPEQREITRLRLSGLREKRVKERKGREQIEL